MGVGSIPSIVLGAGTYFIMVESPRWLAMQGRLTEAQAVIDKVMEPEEGQRVLDQLSSTSPSAYQGGGAGTWQDLFLDPKVNRLLCLGCMVAFFSQATGIESIQYYSVHILENNGGFSRSS